MTDSDLTDVLKFEYFTQLLLDSNYVPLVLKLFAHQDVQQVVDTKMDRVENRQVNLLTIMNSFFQFCNLRSKFKDKSDSDLENEEDEENQTGHSQGDGQSQQHQQQKQPQEGEQDSGQESEDDAVPPPIKRNRPSPPATAKAAEVEDCSEEGQREAAEQEGGGDGASASGSGSGSGSGSSVNGQGGLTRPEVDELGCPVNAIPEDPITDFSWRNFFSLINYLRILQKMCKRKAHRNLLLVQYKSANILRKSLRIPQPELRLYTLKLFKNQVPYCGRKWRQSNMRVITAVYLHCRPELRDEWLAGSDVDAEVDSALPLEQALRSLTHWANVTAYPDQIAREMRVALREEQDFFSRELERLDGGLGGWGADDRADEAAEMEHMVEGWG
ncbi:hypothetical protein E4U54_003149 [Claviceps lovelessii]|nr:hypothetical protein E4U54_003149 [Claviceps lovelessii]